MRKTAINLFKDIGLPYLDMSGYQIDNWFSTALFVKAIEENNAAHYLNKDGFLDISAKEFAEKLAPGLELVFTSQVNTFCFLNDNTILSTSCEGEGEEDGKTELYLLTTDEVVLENFKVLCEKHVSQSKSNTVFALSSGPEGFYLSSLGKLDAPLVKENYTDKILEDYEFVVDDLAAEDPHGRLVIINGPPGTGKTFLVKGLISDLENSTIAIIPPKLISEIDGPSLLPTFISHRRRNTSSIVLVIEDADSCLAPRMNDNISAVSSLLNCADGILGSILDIKIIATTNQARMEFDSALVRPGRLSRHIEVNELDAEKATKVYRRLTGDEKFEYKTKKILADIYIEADLATGGKVKGAKKKAKSKGGYVTATPFMPRRGRIGFGR